MDTAQTAYKEMIQYMLALKSPSFKTEDLAEDKDVASSITEAVKKFTGDDIPKQEYEYIKGQLSSEVALEDVNGTLKLRSTGFQQMIESLKNNSRSTFEEQVAYAKTVHDNQSNMKKVYTKLCLYESYYTGYCNTLTDEEKGALSSEKNLYSQVLGDIKTIFDNVKKISGGWETAAKDSGKKADQLMYEGWYKSIPDIQKSLDEAIDSLDDALKKVKELEGKRKDWNNSINNLSEGDIKSTMKGDYNNSAKSLSKAAVKDLTDKLKAIWTHFKEVKTQLEKIKFYNHLVCDKNYSKNNYYSMFSGKVKEQEFANADKVKEKADSIMKSNYKSGDFSKIKVPEVMKIDNKQQFYRYLQATCHEAEVESETKKEAKAKKKALKEAGNVGAEETSEATELPEGSVTAEVGEDICAILDNLANGEGGVGEDVAIAPMEGSSDGAEADSSMENMEAVGNILSGLNDAMATVRDNVYLEEYMTEMLGMESRNEEKSIDGNGNCVDVWISWMWFKGECGKRGIYK